MKIVIDIPKDVIKCAKSSPNYYPTYYFEKIWKAIVDGTPLPKGYEVDVLDKIRAEIEENYGDYDICEWFEDYDYEENDISEYQQVGDVSDILAIIDKYREEKARIGG